MVQKNKNKWFWIGFFGMVFAAPNATVIKYSLANIDPFAFNVIRYLMISLLTTPFIWKNRKLLNQRNLKHAFQAGFFMALSVVSFVLAIKNSPASYVAIVTLLEPIVFVLYSAKLTGEKITSKAIAGITLAAIGAFIVVALPLAIGQKGEFVFYPLGTMFALINCFVFPLALINFKQANEGGIKMPALMGISSWTVFLINLVFYLALGAPVVLMNKPAAFGILYSGLVVALLSRAINVVSYEHIGSAVVSGLQYMGTILAVLLPLLVLKETISVEMVVGGSLILYGVYVAEHHKSLHHKHRHFIKFH